MPLAPIIANNYKIIFDEWEEFNTIIKSKEYSKIIVIVDENTKQHCLPILLAQLEGDFDIIQIKSGEQHKNLTTCTEVYNQMLHLGADRKSLCINLGGGVIGDMGGFCASTFMRGMDFVQVPTTLLSQVDASVGGKLGVDFNGVKNIIGLFNEPQLVFVHIGFLATLPALEQRSGYAEILKHALIADNNLWQQLGTAPDWLSDTSAQIIHRSIQIKNEVVKQDYKEGGVRKILNFGHTIGHAIESLSFEGDTPLLHGEAIAIGIMTEAYISLQRGLITQEVFNTMTTALTAIYGHHPSYATDDKEIIKLMAFDKKNDGGRIMCSLLDGLGSCLYDQVISEQEIVGALEWYAGFRLA